MSPRRHGAPGSILDLISGERAGCLTLPDVSLDLVDYPFAPPGTLVWLAGEKALKVSTYSGEVIEALASEELIAEAPENADRLGLPSATFALIERRRRTAKRRQDGAAKG